MRSTLFRAEAAQAARDKPLGEVTLIRPLSSGLLAALAIASAAALIALAVWGNYTRKAHVSGYLAPSKGIIKVYAPIAGTVIAKHVKEGEPVTRGQPLFDLSTEQGSLATPQVQAAAIAQLHQRRDSLEQELAQHRDISSIDQHALKQRIASLEQEGLQVKTQLATQQARVRSASATVARYETLAKQKFVSEASLQEKQDDLLEQRGRLQVLDRSAVALQRDLAQVKLEVGSNALKSDTKRESIERDISQLDQQLTEYEAKRVVVISAPADGIVTTVLAEPGQNATTS